LDQRSAYHDAEFLRVLKETSDSHNRLQAETDEIHRLETEKKRMNTDLNSAQRREVT
jgi:hypothetical protein